MTASWSQSDGAVAGGELYCEGRILRVRRHGAVTFASLQTILGERQLVIEARNVVDGGRLRAGQIVRVKGMLEADRNGTERLSVRSIDSCVPCGRWQPDDSDRDRLRRAWPVALTACRQAMIARDFDEILTPILYPVFVGGASVPLSTQVRDGKLLHLRVTSEIALKAQVCQRLRATYEIGSQFRNTPPTKRYGTEFISLEAYWPFHVLSDGEQLLVSIIASIARMLAQNNLIDAARAEGLMSPREFTVADLAKGAQEPDLNPRSSHVLTIGMLERHCMQSLPAGLALAKHLPATMSPLYRVADESAGTAARAWVCVDGVPVADVGEEEFDPDHLQRALQEQERELFERNRGQEENGNSLLLSLARQGQPPMVGLSLSLSRLLGLLLGANGVSSVHLSPWAT